MNNQAYDDTATRNPRKAYTDYENSTYTVVSKVAYLIGVQKRIFENEYEPPKMEWYEKLHADKNARIVRNLCMIRTALELNFKAINNRMRFDMCNLHSLPEYVPQDSLNELLQDGITIVRSRALPAEYIVDTDYLRKAGSFLAAICRSPVALQNRSKPAGRGHSSRARREGG